MKRSLATLVLLSAFAPLAHAATLVFNYGIVYTGDTPSGTAPWMTVTLTDFAANTVDVKIDHNATSGAGQFVSEVLLNLNPFVTISSATAIAGKTATFASAASGSFPNAGTTFDVDVQLNTSNAGGGAQRLLPGDSLTVRLVGNGLSVANFDDLSNGGNQVRTMAHIQNTGGQLGSSKVTEGVPEPATMTVLAGIALAAARRRRK
ncbi:MAG: PEP-CTERM sorting domain-containing protein [Armatimonadetes bacterium]|nr:PEP-CTERM sorting domain-containing protein [Armatimonadota bacterium]MBX3107981.1 PEP-CTERM sorting domain-containing protein [Fimbriimonadaceae bacterium]